MYNERRAVAANRRLDIEAASRRSGTADPYLAGAIGRSRFEANRPRGEVGVIVDALPGQQAYLVSASYNSRLWCSVGGTAAGFGNVGAKSLTTLPIGSVVHFIRHPDFPDRGVIHVVEPHWSTHTANQPADTIWPFTRSGQFVEAAHQEPLSISTTAAGTVPTALGSTEGFDFSAGRPADATTVGEWGVITETGCGVFVDPFQVYMRVDEETGVFGFGPDQMLRVTGHNFQQFTSLCDLEHLDDQGELVGFTRENVYPWEPYGLSRFNQVTPGWLASTIPSHGLAAGQGQRLTDPYQSGSGSGYAVREPEYVSQISASRKYTWSGYLGQGGTTIVSAPMQLDWAYPALPGETRALPVAAVALNGAPAGRLQTDGVSVAELQPYAVPPNTRAAGPDQPGLFEEHRSVAGTYSVRAAKSMYFTKRASIPTPRPVRRQEDPAGDSPLNYAPSGLASGVPAHFVTADVGPAVAVPAGGSAILLPDLIAYTFNWENLHPFAYHTNDWAVAQEGAAGSDLVNQEPPDYTALSLQQYLDRPSYLFLDVDHRYGFVKYFQGESGWALLDDGSVSIWDAWGSEIRMTAGNIEFRAAGDIALYPGRNAITWAGHDVDIKSGDTIDIAATGGDLFIRSEYKFHAVSGNGGCGGFLFENKATCPAYQFAGKVGAEAVSSGFNILCPDSAFMVEAQEINMTLADTAPDGRIYIDAGANKGIYTQSKVFVNNLTTDGSVVHLFNNGPTANEFSEDYTLIGTNLSVNGTGFFSDCLTSGGWIQSAKHFVSTDANKFSQKVVNSAVNVNTVDDEIFTRSAYLTDTYLDAFQNQIVLPEGFEDAEFTHRNVAQYRTSDYTFWESRWQTLAIQDGQSLWSWSETPVIGLRSGASTTSFPGDRRTAAGSYKFTDPTFVDPTTGWTAIDRTINAAVYEAGQTAAISSSNIDSSMKITTPTG